MPSASAGLHLEVIGKCDQVVKLTFRRGVGLFLKELLAIESI